MQQAIPYTSPLPSDAVAVASFHPPQGYAAGKSVRDVVAENAVVVFARRGCCMCHVVKLLLHGHGANLSIFDFDEQNEADVSDQLSKIVTVLQFPAVFVGGELFGGLEKIMSAHISGELVPKLREARALWL